MTVARPLHVTGEHAVVSTGPPGKKSQAHSSLTLVERDAEGRMRIRAGNDRDQEDDLPLPSPPRGDLFLVLGLPGQFQLGCDTLAMTVPDSQTPSSPIGLRDLPPGAHFVWVSSPGAISRQGCWFFSKPDVSVVHVKQWDRYNEVMDECALQNDARFLATEVATLCPKLLSYNADVSGQGQSLSGIWPRLTSCITEQLLSRVAGRPATDHPVEWLFNTTDTAIGEQDVLGLSKPADAGLTELVFLLSCHQIDPHRLMATKSRDPSQMNRAAGDGSLVQHPEPVLFDATLSITELLGNSNSSAGYTERDIVGELQFAFLTGTLISNLSCLEQWWHVVLKVFLRARSLVTCWPWLCRSLIQTLHSQFIYLDRHVVGGFSPGSGATPYVGNEDGRASIFDVMPHGAARLQASLATYRGQFNGVIRHLGKAVAGEQVAADEAFAQLEAWLWQHGWDLRSDHASPTMCEGNADPDDSSDDENSGDRYRSGTGDRKLAHPQSAQTVQSMLYESDDEENQPVLVEFDNNGREIGLVSWD
ncbi:aar2 domain containing protein [Grosmannia clavigera kw1407]|uniref:Aar2 domain containing protein n=1 Tax=Grosmannia clavigera (strain kw1407 / UAMH 11150) TaxID=655863 RepID=F0XIX0_GROCL|nr:aar2 domain containing protein [Grosmannia clavigera kw1407]EFX02058.1 aar2 domain containing protein [Grosmannia clavigera kw1407]